jgi:hypothetical protein
MPNLNDLPGVTLDPSIATELFSGDSDLDLLAQSLSADLALRIPEKFGGLELRVPKTMYRDHPIAVAIGYESAKSLANYAGGGTLFVPRRHPALRTKTKLQVKALIAAGEPRHVIAQRVGFGMRQLRRITQELGLSGVSLAKSGSKSLPAPSEGVSNGGLTGGVACFAPLDTQEASFASQCVIQTKFGIYSPQPQKDQS